MYYQSRRLTENQAQPALLQMQRFLQERGYFIEPIKNVSPDGFDTYYLPLAERAQMPSPLYDMWRGLIYSGYGEEIPWGYDGCCFILTKHAALRATKHTVSKSHITLPDTRTLLSLTPDDFFILFQYLADQRETSYLEAPTEELPPAIQSWFISYLKGLELDPAITINKWTSRDVIRTVALLPPTLSSQAAAIQYIDALRYKDIPFIPADSAIELELEWEQVRNTDGEDLPYCYVNRANLHFVNN